MIVVTVAGLNLMAADGDADGEDGDDDGPAGADDGEHRDELKFMIPLGAVTGKISVTTVDGAAQSATNLTVVQPPRATGSHRRRGR